MTELDPLTGLPVTPTDTPPAPAVATPPATPEVTPPAAPVVSGPKVGDVVKHTVEDAYTDQTLVRHALVLDVREDADGKPAFLVGFFAESGLVAGDSVSEPV